MNKKRIWSVMLLSIGTILLSVLLAYGITSFLKQKNVAETGNVLGVKWYDPLGTEFLITTKEELYELAELSDFYTFEGQTIKLGSDIVINEGNATEWAEKAPAERWIPISDFTGVFDGQGHTISGLYGKSMEAPMGLFTYTNRSCTIQDLKLVNSYFETRGSSGTGSFSGIGNGNFIKLYSDAIINCKGETAGGIIGCIESMATLDECWYDGNLHITARECGGLVATVLSGRVTIKHCLFSGTLVSEHSFDATRSGGVVGRVDGTVGINISDTLVSGELTMAGAGYSGSVMGVAYAGAQVIFTDTYDGALCNQTSSVASGVRTGNPIEVKQQLLIGEKAYQWTSLDFENYWAALENETPVLKYFTKDAMDLNGVEKEYDTSWYSKNLLSFTITNVKQLYGLSMLAFTTDFKGAIIRLDNDIVLNEGNAANWIKNPSSAPNVSWTPIGTISLPFAGTFDGQGHTISGLYINDGENYRGLFGCTYIGSMIKNLKLSNGAIISKGEKKASRIGAVAGESWGSFDSIYSDIDIVAYAENIGGIAGRMTYMDTTYNNPNMVSNCWYDGEISLVNGGRTAGGIVGEAGKGSAPEGDKVVHTFSNCLFTGTIKSDRPPANTDKVGGQYIGGIVGQSGGYTVRIIDSLSAGKFETECDVYMGSFFGHVRDSESHGVVELNNAYTTKESWIRADGGGGKRKGGVIVLSEKTIIGYGGYQNTSLDFEKFWSVVKDDTPILSTFAKQKVSLSGVAKNVDTSWYRADEKTYILDSVQDLYGFAMLSQCTNFADKIIKLGADIAVNETSDSILTAWRNGEVVPEKTWTPVGVPSLPFAGVFDGQSHTISGVYLKDTSEKSSYTGLFGVTAVGSRIQDLRLENSYFERTGTTDHIALLGSIAGEARGELDSVYSNAVIIADGQIVGGIAGRLSYQDTNYKESLKVNNCWFDGEINGGVKFVGGITGAISRGANVKDYEKAVVEVTNCLNTGYITNARVGIEDGFGGQYVAGIVGTDWMDCVLVIDKCVNAGTIDLTFKVYAGAIFSRKMSKNSKITIRDSYAVKEAYSPLYGGESGSIDNRGKLYNQSQISDTLAYAYMDVDFENTWLAVKDETPILRTFANGVEGVYEDFSWYKDAESPYKISTEEQLKAFARLVNAGDTFVDDVIQLKKDMYLNGQNNEEWVPSIDVNGQLVNIPNNQWNSMGDYTSSAFRGTFTGLDGDVLHSISGVYINQASSYAGLFGFVGTEGTIENIKLKNSYIGSTSSRVGAVAGAIEGNVRNVYVDESVTVKGVDSVGGITGNFGGGNKQEISDCWVAGNIYNTKAHTGGIAGIVYRGNKTVANCLFTGEIHSTSDKVGGVAGYVFTNDVDSKFTVQESVFAGTISAANTSDVGGVLGKSEGKVHLITNNYYSTDKRSGNTAKVSSILGKQIYVSLSELLGNNAYIYTDIAFRMSEGDSDKWIATAVGPELALFSENNAIYNLSGQKVDTAWYYNNWDGQSGKLYEINNLAKMYGFERIVNNGDTFQGDTVKLTTDIYLNGTGNDEWIPVVNTNGTLNNVPNNQWKPMGTFNVPFKGTFTGLDGDTIHSIHGIYVNATEAYAGLFGFVGNTGTVENLKIENSYYTTSGIRVGAVTGGTDGSLTRLYVGKNVTVNGADSVGGITGFFGEGYTKEISNCWVAGHIFNSKGQTGGIVGMAYRGTKTISNCLFTGSIHSTNANVGGLLGYTATNSTQSRLVLKNNVVMATGITTGQASSTSGILGLGTAGVNLEIENVYTTTSNYLGNLAGVTSLKGKVAILTTQEIIGDGAYQNTALSLRNTVTSNAPWIATEQGPQLAIFATVTPDYQWSGQKVDTSWYYNEWTKAASNTYHIDSVADLYGFGKIVRAGVDVFTNQKVCLDTDLDLNPGWIPNVNANGQLTNSSGVNSWTSIGTTNAATSFKGTFDGQGHSISGMYQIATASMSGMFARLEVGSVVKNLKILNSYFSSTAPSSTALSTWDVGSIAGCAQGDLSNIYSNAIVVSNTWDAGGMIGRLRVTASGEVRKIENCWFDGQLLIVGNNELCKSNGAYGGIVGRLAVGADKNVCTYEITNCLNTGTVKRTASNTSSYVGYVGGIAGGEFGAYSANIKYTDCLNVGSVTDSARFKGGIAGILRGNVTMKDCYSTTESCETVAGQLFNGTTFNNGATFNDADFKVSRNSILLENARTGASGLFNANSTAWTCDTVSSEKRGTPILSYFAEWWKTVICK